MIATHYDLLEVSRAADTATIRSAYRRLIREHHPDLAGDRGAAMSQKLNEAVRVLTSPDLRREYDRSLIRPAAPTAAPNPEPQPFPPPTPAPVPDRLPSARARKLLLISGLVFISGWLVMLLARPMDGLMPPFAFLFGLYAFIVSTKHLFLGYPFSKGWLFNVMTIVLTLLYWTPFVGAVMGGIGLWTLSAAALYATGSLLIAGRRIPL